MILNIYKEPGWTSFDVVAKIRSQLKQRRGTKRVKVGHAGTLDPLAEGVLVVLTDLDTKKQDTVLGADKRYRAKIAVGAYSPSYDLETPLEFTERLSVGQIKQTLPGILPKFLGEFDQVVPLYSAKKVDGQRLYDLARGDSLEGTDLPSKRVTIYSIEVLGIEVEEVLEFELPVITCDIVCGKGTYIRSLARDIGVELGSSGVLVHLIRTGVGDYFVEDSKKLDELKF